jgi:hypothetical protein
MDDKKVITVKPFNVETGATEIFQMVADLHKRHLFADSITQHHALGEAYSAIDETGDKFLEAYMGKYGKPASLAGDNDKAVLSCVAKLTTYRDSLADSALRNILEELIGDLYQVVYKLSRKA